MKLPRPPGYVSKWRSEEVYTGEVKAQSNPLSPSPGELVIYPGAPYPSRPPSKSEKKTSSLRAFQGKVGTEGIFLTPKWRGRCVGQIRKVLRSTRPLLPSSNRFIPYSICGIQVSFFESFQFQLVHHHDLFFYHHRVCGLFWVIGSLVPVPSECVIKGVNQVS